MKNAFESVKTFVLNNKLEVALVTVPAVIILGMIFDVC